MGSIKKGDRVSIRYVGKFESHVFTTNRQEVAKESGLYSPHKSYRPYTFTVGSGEVIKAIEEGITGMEKGEQKEITVTPEKGFGHPKEELIAKLPMKVFRQNNIEAKKGMVIVTPQGRGEIIDIQKDSVTVDFNYPLSGKVLVYDVTIEDVGYENFHGQEGSFHGNLIE